MNSEIASLFAVRFSDRFRSAIAKVRGTHAEP